jgi:hypothetical protein
MNIEKASFLAILFSAWLFVPSSGTACNPCQQTQQVQFTCIVGACQQTITHRPCRSFSTGPFITDCCGFTIPCCGSEVCDAVVTDAICPTWKQAEVEQAASLKSNEIRKLYVLSSAGGFVPLELVLHLNETRRASANAKIVARASD